MKNDERRSPLSVKELDSFLKSEPFKFISLIDGEGSTVVAFNNPRIKIENRKKEILEKLRSTIVPDGLYFLLFKDQLENANVTRVPIQKGSAAVSMSDPGTGVRIVEKIVREENALSFDKALEYLSRIKTLEVENEQLKLQVEQLNDELENDEPDGGFLSEVESSPVLSGLFERVPGLIDKYFENRDRELKALEDMAAKKPQAPAVAIPRRPVAPVAPIMPVAPVVIPYYSPGSSGGSQAAAPEESTEELERELALLPDEDLIKVYAGVRASGNLKNMKVLIQFLKTSRPGILEKIFQISKGETQ